MEGMNLRKFELLVLAWHYLTGDGEEPVISRRGMVCPRVDGIRTSNEVWSLLQEMAVWGLVSFFRGPNEAVIHKRILDTLFRISAAAGGSAVAIEHRLCIGFARMKPIGAVFARKESVALNRLSEFMGHFGYKDIGSADRFLRSMSKRSGCMGYTFTGSEKLEYTADPFDQIPIFPSSQILETRVLLRILDGLGIEVPKPKVEETVQSTSVSEPAGTTDVVDQPSPSEPEMIPVPELELASTPTLQPEPEPDATPTEDQDVVSVPQRRHRACDVFEVLRAKVGVMVSTTTKDIMNILGVTSTESTSHSLSRWEESGLLTIHKERISGKRGKPMVVGITFLHDPRTFVQKKGNGLTLALKPESVPASDPQPESVPEPEPVPSESVSVPDPSPTASVPTPEALPDPAPVQQSEPPTSAPETTLAPDLVGLPRNLRLLILLFRGLNAKVGEWAEVSMAHIVQGPGAGITEHKKITAEWRGLSWVEFRKDRLSTHGGPMISHVRFLRDPDELASAFRLIVKQKKERSAARKLASATRTPAVRRKRPIDKRLVTRVQRLYVATEGKSFLVNEQTFATSGYRSSPDFYQSIRRFQNHGWVEAVKEGRRYKEINWRPENLPFKVEIVSTSPRPMLESPPADECPTDETAEQLTETPEVPEPTRLTPRFPSACAVFNAFKATVGEMVKATADEIRKALGIRGMMGVYNNLANWEEAGLLTTHRVSSSAGGRHRIAGITFLHDPNVFAAGKEGADDIAEPAEEPPPAVQPELPPEPAPSPTDAVDVRSPVVGVSQSVMGDLETAYWALNRVLTLDPTNLLFGTHVTMAIQRILDAERKVLDERGAILVRVVE